jgi:hypothetical protein
MKTEIIKPLQPKEPIYSFSEIKNHDGIYKIADVKGGVDYKFLSLDGRVFRHSSESWKDVTGAPISAVFVKATEKVLLSN